LLEGITVLAGYDEADPSSFIETMLEEWLSSSEFGAFRVEFRATLIPAPNRKSGRRDP
jgi:hypothetical protein